MIDQFIAQVKTVGMARTNRFLVTLPWTEIGPSEMRDYQLFCDTVSLPGISMQSTPSRFWGEQREIPYERSFEPVTLTFYVDTDMVVKKAFDYWFNQIQEPSTRVMGYYKDYTKNVTIDVLPMDSDTPSYSLTLYEAFPKTIGSVQLDAASREVMKLSVTLAYKYYTTEAYENATELPPLTDADTSGNITGVGTPSDMGSFSGMRKAVSKAQGLRNTIGGYIDKRPLGENMIETAKRNAVSTGKEAARKVYDRFKGSFNV